MCVLELLPSSAQSFRLLLPLLILFLNSGGSPCIIKAVSALCQASEVENSPQPLCVAVQHFVSGCGSWVPPSSAFSEAVSSGSIIEYQVRGDPKDHLVQPFQLKHDLGKTTQHPVQPNL